MVYLLIICHKASVHSAWLLSFYLCSFEKDLRKDVSDIHGYKTHSSKGVGDPQPYGGDKRRDVAKGQETKHGQREDGTAGSKDAPKTYVILKQTGHQKPHSDWAVTGRDSHAYYENANTGWEDQRTVVNGSGDVGRLLLTVAAVLVLNKLTKQNRSTHTFILKLHHI